MENDDRTGADQRVVRLDGTQIRTLAHPLRARLLAMLRADGPATATQLAQRLATNTGATSYHLRQLAEVGLVAEEPHRGTGRQRYWRARHEVSTWQNTDFDDDPDATAALDWISGSQIRFLAEQAQRWITNRHDHSRDWRGAADFSDVLLTLTPQRLRALNEELWQVIGRYRAEPSTGEDAQQVHLFLAGFPRVTGGDR